MFFRLKDLQEYSILAADGEIGRAVDFYIDDQDWSIRYLVLETGPWILGRRVLVSPAAAGDPDPESKQIPLSLTRDQVKASPEIDTDKPVSRQQEQDLHDHYGWPVYWGSLPGNPGSMVMGMPPNMAIESAIEEGDENGEAFPRRGETGLQEGPNLRSFREVSGYSIKARDGEAGRVADLLVDETWTIRYLIVDTGSWLPGRKVLFAPAWITLIRGDRSQFEVDLSQETIRNSPEYDSGVFLDREYERSLFDHYGKSGNWD
jgi:hypothetical protein